MLSEVFMKLGAVIAAFSVGVLFAASSSAAIYSKSVAVIKATFDKNGANKCSDQLAGTLEFLVNGRSLIYSQQWMKKDANNNPILVDFMIAGTKSNYSLFGSVMLMPDNSKCSGSYVASYVASTANCKAYMEKEGFNGPEFIDGSNDSNGDGGTAYLRDVKDKSQLSFIFNDVAGGCSVTKRESLSYPINK
jgi:hypothetical protein